MEIDRLVRANPQHPAARVLLEGSQSDRTMFGRLHEALAAADMDLARMTYANERELRAYCVRSAGAIQELIAAQLLAPLPLDESLRAVVNRIGVGLRLTEILRDVRQDACEGRVYVPLDEMERHSLTIEALRAREVTDGLRGALASLATVTTRELGDEHLKRLPGGAASCPPSACCARSSPPTTGSPHLEAQLRDRQRAYRARSDRETLDRVARGAQGAVSR